MVHEAFTGPFGEPAVVTMGQQALERERALLDATLRAERAELGRRDMWYFLTEILFPDTWHLHYSETFHMPMCEDLMTLGQGEDSWCFVPRKRRKCLVPSARVTRYDGTQVAARELRVGDRIIGTLDENGWATGPVTVEALESQPAERCVRLRLRSGRTLDVSSNHPVRTLLGWKEAGQAQGARVAVSGPWQQSKGMLFGAEAACLGYLIGDGGTTQASLSFTSADPGVVASFDAALRALGGKLEKRKDQWSWGVHGALPIVRQHGLLGVKSINKRIPQSVMRAEPGAKWRFLGAWFDCDGGVGNGGTDLRFYTSSEGLAKDGQHLLTSLGVAAEITSRQPKGGQRAYMLGIRDRNDLALVIKSMPVSGRRVEQFKFLRRGLERRSRGRMRCLPPEWRQLAPRGAWATWKRAKVRVDNVCPTSYDKAARALAVVPIPEVEACLDAAVQWDQVVEVEELGVLPTLAVQTSSGTLLVEDVITHNTYVRVFAYSLWLMARDPNIRILLAGAREATVRPWALLVRAALTAGDKRFARFQETYPELLLREKQLLMEFTVPARTVALSDPTFRATYVGVTGAGWRADVVLFDDVVERRNVSNPEMSSKRLTEIMDFIPLLDDTGPYQNIVGNGTRWAFHDPYGIILGEASEGEANEQAEEVQKRIAEGRTRILVRHGAEDPTRSCEHCPPHVVARYPHGHPTLAETSVSCDPEIHPMSAVWNDYARYKANPNLGESLFYHQIMNVCLAPSDQKIRPEWFLRLGQPSWPVAKRRVLCIDSADKDFQKEGIGDWMVALMGDFDDYSRLAVRHGIRSRDWTRQEFIRRIVSWCKAVGWWPTLLVKEKFGNDSWLSDLQQALLQEYHPAHAVTFTRPDKQKKRDWIVNTLQAPMELGDVVWGSLVPGDLVARAQYEGCNLGQVVHEDLIETLALFFIPTVRPQAPQRGLQAQQAWPAPPMQPFYYGQQPAAAAAAGADAVEQFKGGGTLILVSPELGLVDAAYRPQGGPEPMTLVFDPRQGGSGWKAPF